MELAIFIISLMYIVAPLSKFAPNGSIVPVKIFVSFASVSIILGLY